MNFDIGDIPFYKEYVFTDTGEIKPHFGLVLLPEKATKYQGSNLCCVVTSKCPPQWFCPLSKDKYSFFSVDSFVCLDRKDLVSKNGLADGVQPKGSLDGEDLKKTFKKLKASLFCIKDLASDPYIRGTIIKEWKQKLKEI
ncbi:MAG: hypothetical protein M0R20_04510 [Candidatus Omnitrophica bacterium]|jgi:hypothetical protein|nr:hypothetical protein [Candidatus Omnitrophota bacterium]